MSDGHTEMLEHGGHFGFGSDGIIAMPKHRKPLVDHAYDATRREDLRDLTIRYLGWVVLGMFAATFAAGLAVGGWLW